MTGHGLLVCATNHCKVALQDSSAALRPQGPSEHEAIEIEGNQDAEGFTIHRSACSCFTITSLTCQTLPPLFSSKPRWQFITCFKIMSEECRGSATEIGHLASQMRGLALEASEHSDNAASSTSPDRGPVILILDDPLQSLPWESLPDLRNGRQVHLPTSSP